MQSRPRRRSLTGPGSRHKSITPSPLSQSTSAVHLSTIDPNSIQMPRRLSKRRKPFNGLFTGSVDSPHVPGHTSEPPTPLETSVFRHGMPKRGSTVAPSSASTSPSLDKKEKRGSVLGRLVKRFSILRRSDTARGPPPTRDSRYFGNRASVHGQPLATRSSPAVHKTTAPSVAPSDMSRRVPPPSIESAAQPSVDTRTPKDDEVASFTSSEAPTSVRKLTIANPDEPSSSDANTPVMESSPLPVVQESRMELERLTIPSRDEPRTSVLEVPLSNSPVPLQSPAEDSPHVYQSRLSTILSAPSDHPGLSSSPPLPDLPPSTPGPISPGIIPSEHSLPPTPLPTRPPSPSESVVSSVLPPLPPPSPSIRSHDGLTRAMSPAALSAFKATLPEIEESPLSRASMVVNPPTPMPPTIKIPKSPSAAPVPMPRVQPIQQATPQSSEGSKSSREHSPTKRENSQRAKTSSSSSKIRRTETFKLVRSPSGHVQSVGEGFVVEGEHWEVVASPVEESSKTRKKSRSKTKEEETPAPLQKESRRNSRHERRSEDDTDAQKGRDRHRMSINGRHHADTSSSSSNHTPQYVNGHTTQTDSPERRRSSHKVVKSASTDATPTERHERRRSSTRETRPREPEAAARSTQTPTANHVSSSYTQSTHLSSAPSTRRERKTSSSTRPTSEIQSTADVNTLKAKEAWDMDRLWKGRSMMYGPDGTTLISTRPTIGSDSRPSTIMSADLHRAASIPSVGDLRASPIPKAHGSSHTYFMVQAPYQGQPNGHAHSLSGTQSPPIIYTPSSPNQSSSPRRDYSKQYRSFADAVPFPTTTNPPDHASQRMSNPLPEPPRLSTYRPSPIPSSIAGSGEGPSSPEYWASLAGVTSTH